MLGSVSSPHSSWSGRCTRKWISLSILNNSWVCIDQFAFIPVSTVSILPFKTRFAGADFVMHKSAYLLSEKLPSCAKAKLPGSWVWVSMTQDRPCQIMQKSTKMSRPALAAVATAEELLIKSEWESYLHIRHEWTSVGVTWSVQRNLHTTWPGYWACVCIIYIHHGFNPNSRLWVGGLKLKKLRHNLQDMIIWAWFLGCDSRHCLKSSWPFISCIPNTQKANKIKNLACMHAQHGDWVFAAKLTIEVW